MITIVSYLGMTTNDDWGIHVDICLQYLRPSKCSTNGMPMDAYGHSLGGDMAFQSSLSSHTVRCFTVKLL